MKILHVIPSVNSIGGGPIEGLKQLYSAYQKYNHISIEVCSLDCPTDIWVKRSEIKTHAMGPRIGKYGVSFNLIPWLKKHRNDYDFVVINGLWQFTGFATWWVFSGTKIPYFVFTHGMLDPWFKKNYPFKHIKKWLYWPWAEYRILRDARRVIFTCEEERILARQSFWLYSANEAVTKYGVALPPKNIKKLSSVFYLRYPNLNGKRIVLFLSRIHEKKGCDLLLLAFAEIAKSDSNLHLVIAGPDQDGWIQHLKSMADKLDISDQITWTGMLEGDMKWGAFYTAEVFCLPSHQENFGIVVAEALSCCIPVLISNKVNIWREINDVKAGFVDSDNYDGTLRNLKKWLVMSPSEMKHMKKRALICFKNNFHIEAAAARLLEIFESSL